MTNVVVLGSVGNCLDIVDAWRAAQAASKVDGDLIGFLDDATSDNKNMAAGLPIFGPLSLAPSMAGVNFICGIGSSRSYMRKPEILAKLALPRDRYASIVHPAATISPSVVIGAGTVILANTTLCANVSVGDHAMMLPGCVVGHDSHIGTYSIMAAGVIVSGHVTVGTNCYLGARCVLREGTTIGDGALVGLGAGVIADVSPRTTVIGLPARNQARAE